MIAITWACSLQPHLEVTVPLPDESVCPEIPPPWKAPTPSCLIDGYDHSDVRCAFLGHHLLGGYHIAGGSPKQCDNRVLNNQVGSSQEA